MLRVLDLFSGIGAYALGVERAGMKVVAFCESEEFPRKVLRKHWPDVPIYEDVRTLTADTLRRDGIAVDVIVGGWPCQDISSAGPRTGLDGARSGLWSEVARLLGELRPAYAILENSSNLLSSSPDGEPPGRDFSRVLGDLAALGRDAEWHCLPAAAFDAPHIRDRVWIITTLADAARNGGPEQSTAPGKRGQERKQQQQPQRPRARSRDKFDRSRETDGGAIADAHGFATIGTAIARQERFSWQPEPAVGRVVHGASDRVDRIHALGNCNPPIVPETIARAVIQSMGLKAADGARCNEGEKQ